MNAGKTTTLLQSNYNYQERGMRTLVGFVDGRRFALVRWRRLAYHRSLVQLSLRRLSHSNTVDHQRERRTKLYEIELFTF